MVLRMGLTMMRPTSSSGLGPVILGTRFCLRELHWERPRTESSGSGMV